MAQAKTPQEKYADKLLSLQLEQSPEYRNLQRKGAVQKAKDALHARNETRTARITSTWDDKLAESDHLESMDEAVLRRILAGDRRLSKLAKEMDAEDSPESTETETSKGKGKSSGKAIMAGASAPQ